MSYEEFDLDSILADFRSGADDAQPPAEAPEGVSMPAAEETAAEEQAYVEPDWQGGADEDAPAEEPLPEEEGDPFGSDEEPEEKPAHRKGLFKKRAPKKDEIPDEDEIDFYDEDDYEEPPRKLPFGVRLLLNPILMALICLCLWWTLTNLHPVSAMAASRPVQTPAVTAAPVVTETPAPAETPEVSAAPELTPEPPPEPTPEPVSYYIPEDVLVAPAPDPNAFGSVPLDQAEKVLDVIAQARESGLLREDEEVVFDPNANFYTGLYAEEIKYYLDDSILVILWKEDMDGRCCSFSEIKVRDGSQFRRKLADDTFGSYNYYFASELAASTNCVVAMNADYYAFRDFGIVAYNRELYRFNTSTYTGNYKKYNCFDTLFVTADGDFLYKELLEENTEDSIRQWMAENDVLFSLAFGPILVRDGEAQVVSWYPAGEVDTAYSRAGIAIKDKLHYLFMTVNHGSNAANCTVNKMAEFFARKGVITAYGLDGGQTSEIVWQGVPYNHVDWASERLVSDIIYFASAVGSTREGGGN